MGNNDINATQKKNLNYLDVWAIAFGCMVGWGVFVMPGTTFLPVAGPVGSIIAMIIGTAVMLVIGNNFAFLMNKISKSGGIYTYTKEAFGQDHAFITSWFLCLSYLTIVFLNGTALFIVLKTIFGDIIQTGFSYTIAGNKIYIGEIIVSVAALAGIGVLCIFAKNAVRWLNTILAVIMFTGILIISAHCIPHAFTNNDLSSVGFGNSSAAYGVFSIVFLAPWAFVGFEVICFDTNSFKFPLKKSNKIITVAIIIAGLAYTAMALVGASAFPSEYGNWVEYLRP